MIFCILSLGFGPKLSLDKNFKWDNRQDKHTGRRHVGRYVMLYYVKI